VLPILHFVISETRDEAKRSAAELLSRLYARESAVSAERRDLHARIDDLYLKAKLDESDIAELDRLEALENDLSDRRSRLHAEIDVLRTEVGLPPWRVPDADAEQVSAAPIPVEQS
jgi:hypothetical protein